MSVRRGGIPGPESRTGLVRPAMSEAEFERRLGGGSAGPQVQAPSPVSSKDEPDPAEDQDPPPADQGSSGRSPSGSSGSSGRSRSRGRAPSKARRVQRMFAVEEELDKKLWLYAIHVGKDRSDVVNDLLRPVVASMVLYDSRDRRSSGRSSDGDGDGSGND